MIVSALLVGAWATNAQNYPTALDGNRLGDNWSVELKTGGITPLTHSAFFKNMRPAFGLSVGKQLTPVFGLGLQGMGYVNTTSSPTAFDASDISLLGKVNLMNLLGGYPGYPRFFEVEALAGMGWLHYYQQGPGDTNSWSTRLGLNLNFNLGDSRAWTLGIKPAIVYDMQGDFSWAKSRFNANCAAFELTAGLTYHFAGSNGRRYMTLVTPYDQLEVDELNERINELRLAVADREAQLAATHRQVNALQCDLTACREQAPRVQTVLKDNRIPESTVSFRQGKSVVDASQQPNVERVAVYLKRHPEASVVIKGYASPEGDAALNERLATARAQAVKSILVNKYRIDDRRVTAIGQGVGDLFSEPDWNRVGICTIQEAR